MPSTKLSPKSVTDCSPGTRRNMEAARSASCLQGGRWSSQAGGTHGQQQPQAASWICRYDGWLQWLLPCPAPPCPAGRPHLVTAS
jgi:hypothetical protein